MSDERPPYVAEAWLRLSVDDTRFLTVDVGHPYLDMEDVLAEHFGIELPERGDFDFPGRYRVTVERIE